MKQVFIFVTAAVNQVKNSHKLQIILFYFSPLMQKLQQLLLHTIYGHSVSSKHLITAD